MKSAACLLLVGMCAATAQAQYWVGPMRLVRQNYQDNDGPAQGTIARFGDSISVSQAYFCPLESAHANTTPESQAALDWIQAWLTDDCWGWQEEPYWFHGCYGGRTSSWPLELAGSWPGSLVLERRVDYWLRNDNPEIAVIMWGTNDLHSALTPAEYKSNLQQVVAACLANQQRAAELLQAARELAVEENLPLIDFYDECVTRNPHNPPVSSWDGADPMWSAYGGYEVPTSICHDGAHPSNYTPGKSDFSETGLRINGYNLRNYLTLMKSYEVYQQVIVPEPSCALLVLLGAAAVVRRRTRHLRLP